MIKGPLKQILESTQYLWDSDEFSLRCPRQLRQSDWLPYPRLGGGGLRV